VSVSSALTSTGSISVEDERDLVEVAPAPVLAGLERADDRMRCGVMVGGCMAVGGLVAAADVTAGEADPRMEPLTAVAQTVLAAVDRGRELVHLDLIKMGAGIAELGCCHPSRVASATPLEIADSCDVV
jgi:hypothetical protein